MKLGPHLFVMLGALALDTMAISSGYQSVYVARKEHALCVVPGQHRVAELAAVEATLAGARAELSRAGALHSGSCHPRIVVEVLRLDEQSLGVARIETQGREVPSTRGVRLAVVGRARLESSAEQPLARDSGDMRRTEQYASSPVPGVDAANRADAIRSAARRLGRALARRLLGEPEPLTEEL